MLNARFTLSYNEHMELLPPSIDSLGYLLARSYKTKQNDFMIS